MGLQFVLGPSGHGKSTYVQEWMIAEAEKHRDRDFLMIVPDQFTMQTQMIMSKKSPNGGILNIDVLSFGRLSHRIFKEVGRPERVMLDDLGKVLILRRVIQEQEEKLSVLKKGIHRPGYVEEVKSVLSEFMQYNIRPEDLDEKTETLPVNPALKGKLKDFVILYKAFLDALEEKYTTKEENLSCLSERIPYSALIKRSVLVFDGFTGFTPLQLTVISALLENALDIIITLPYGEDPKENGSYDDLFYLSGKTIRDLTAIAKDLEIPVKEAIWQKEHNRFAAAPAIAYLERNLFRLSEAAYPFEPEEIHITKATDETHECRILCRQMFDLIRNKNYRYRDMAVVCADMETYKDALKEQFEKYDIPYFLDATTDLTSNPFVGYLDSVLQVLIGNFNPADVTPLLKSEFLRIPAGRADKLDNYILARNIRGRSAWYKDFKTPDRRNKKKFAYLPEDKREEAKEKYLEKLNEIRKKFTDVFAPFEGLSVEKATAREYLTALYQVAEQGNAARILYDMARSFEEEGEPEKALEYDQVYKLVMDLFDRIVSLIGEEEISLKELKEILDTGFGEIRIGIIPKSVDVLPVCDLIRSRFGEIKALFLLGVNDGNIPANGAGGGLLSDLERSTLLNLGMELAPNRAMESFAQKLYLYQVLTKPSEELFLSYLSVTEEGKSKLPSYLIGEMKGLYPKLKAEDETMAAKVLSEEGYEKTLRNHTVLNKKDLYSEFALRLGDYANGGLSDEEMEYTGKLFASLKGDEEIAEAAERLVHAAFDSYYPKPLNEEVAKKLYRDALSVSISSLEKFASCAYAHFLAYGLKLSERETAEVGSVDYGNIMHHCMEKFGQYCKENQKDIRNLSEEETGDILDEIISGLFTDESDLITVKTKENPYLRNRLEKILRRSVESAQRQLRHGDFVPAYHEWPFKRVINERGDVIRGKIDRVDLCDTDDSLYVKIVDYKSGSKDFDEELFQLGVQIQTVVYLNEAIQILKKHAEAGDDSGVAEGILEGKEIKPGALFYYKLQDPYLKEDKVNAEVEKVRFGTLAPTGLFVAEDEVLSHLENQVSGGKSEAVPASFHTNGSMYPNKSAISMEDMKKTMEKADQMVLSAVEEIASGRIDLNPLETDQYSSCKFCPFKSACGFDEKIGGYKKRRGVENPDGEETEDEDDE